MHFSGCINYCSPHPVTTELHGKFEIPANVSQDVLYLGKKHIQSSSRTASIFLHSLEVLQ